MLNLGPMKIVIVDDEAELLKRLTVLFESEGYNCVGIDSYGGLQDFVSKRKLQPDLIVLDRMLGGQDSVSLIQKIKNTFSKTNILVLSAVDTAIEKADALNAGADDYLAKPFSSVELLARVKVLTRRISLYNSNVVAIGNTQIQLSERQVVVDGQSLNLTFKELSVFHLLASNPGKVYSKEVLLELVWKQNSGVETKVVEVAINKIRKELLESHSNVNIKNIRNVGYWVES